MSEMDNAQSLRLRLYGEIPGLTRNFLDKLHASGMLLLARLSETACQVVDVGKSFYIYCLTHCLQVATLTKQSCRAVAIDRENRPDIFPVRGIGRDFHTYQFACNKVGRA